jgi:glutaredoxin 3
MSVLELYGSSTCPYTQEMRDWLEWRNREFYEYDVDTDPDANTRLRALSGGSRNVPVLVEDGKVIQIGWQGRSCIAGTS